ncbi:hypothetical protein [Ammoniphilus sp. CFH 90114]|uniref:hypothetical protein n=1 Tax=Ammoniphilus sp. CFH 90114 TaxID=2493665 RepID=UPI00100E8C86|nr:hypothetical protein [Ammoniphilus sp. CFH 90114]RXT08077.1 hypothetical protein EIZ39_11750 [Ammoniphilus sp. CFH 90114]
MAPKKKKVISSSFDNMKHYMKSVTSDTCIQCTQQCQRGLAYIEKMSKPGAIGYGVSCILTRGTPTQDTKSKAGKRK